MAIRSFVSVHERVVELQQSLRCLFEWLPSLANVCLVLFSISSLMEISCMFRKLYDSIPSYHGTSTADLSWRLFVVVACSHRTIAYVRIIDLIRVILFRKSSLLHPLRSYSIVVFPLVYWQYYISYLLSLLVSSFSKTMECGARV